MRWLAIAVAVLALTGCSDSDDSLTTDTSSTNEITDAPRAYTELIAQLPPFDELPTDEVTAYRLALLEARSERCAPRTAGADKAAFLRANAEVLALAGTARGAQLVSQLAVPHRDGNGSPTGSGPPTYFTTERTYRLPRGTTISHVFAHYERVLHYGWLETSGRAPCVRSFAQAAAFHHGRRLWREAQARGARPCAPGDTGRRPTAASSVRPPVPGRSRSALAD